MDEEIQMVFLSKMTLDNDDKCWNWCSTKDMKGYGKILRKRNGKKRAFMVHRISYETFIGPIPNGLVIDHLCDNPSCHNPTHLEPKTIYENAKRGVKKVKKNFLNRGVCVSGIHKILSEKDCYLHKGRPYACRKCKLGKAKIDPERVYTEDESVYIEKVRERDRVRKRKDYWEKRKRKSLAV
jgi:hypothetical protein